MLLSLALLACNSAATGGGDPNGGGGTGGTGGGGGGPAGGGMPLGGDVAFPWPVFDGTVPDTPEATGGGNTYYCDPVNGKDSNDGKTFATAKKTITAAMAIPGLTAGDTVLLGGGIYREYPKWGGATGKPGAPITIGSYGRGTGAPIIDGGVKPATWTKYTTTGQTTIWSTSTAGTKITSTVPVLGIYVGTGKAEYALREVLHGQVKPYGSDPLPPNQTQANLKDNSNQWYFDAANQMLYADFGGTLGSGDPNAADISLLYDSQNGPNGHELLIYFPGNQGYFHFVGVTLRASSWSAAFIQSSGNVFDRCDVKFNGGTSILFSYTSTMPTDNVVRQSRIWMNILHNWPRFNNGYTGAGWPGAIAWDTQNNVVAEGNLIYQNGGEGLIIGGTNIAGQTSMNNVARHNIIFDNFSVNLYVQETTNATLDGNFVFDHPRDPSQTFDKLFEVSNGYNVDYGKRITPINLNLGDEPGAAYDMKGHLANITVVNNIFAGGNYGFIDFDDGTVDKSHGLKSCTIADNTWILDNTPNPGPAAYGWRHAVADPANDPSTNSFIQNNIFVTAMPADFFLQLSATPPGITVDYNVYGGPGVFSGNSNPTDFTGWKAVRAAWDQHSVNSDAMLTDVSEFNKPATEKLIYDWTKATPVTGSPALGTGTTQPVDHDFTGATRGSGNSDIGAIGRH